MLNPLSSTIRSFTNSVFKQVNFFKSGGSATLNGCIIQQQRFLSNKRKKRHTVNPFWHASVTRTKYPEGITKENEEFLEEVVKDQYSSPLANQPWARGEWNSKSQRCGLVGKKIGSYPMWKKNGKCMMTTLIHIDDNHVIRHVPYAELCENEPYNVAKFAKKPRDALVVGSEGKDPRNFTKEYYNMFLNAGVMPKKKLTSFLVTPNAILQPGTPLYATHFRPNDRVDIVGYTTDRGFQGVLTRWKFKGMPRTHGNTRSHRRPGYIGCGGKRATVLPGKKMPGHMGMQFRRLRGSRIVRINQKFNCIWVEGRVMGPVGGHLNIYDSGLWHNRYRDPENHPPFPTHFPAEQEIEGEDLYAEDVHPFSEPTLEFEKDEQEKKA